MQMRSAFNMAALRTISEPSIYFAVWPSKLAPTVGQRCIVSCVVIWQLTMTRF